MNKWIFIICLVSVSILKAQDFHAWVYFNDKPNVAVSLANPSTILTQDAIDRKARHGVIIDERDVPMNQTYVDQVKTAPGITYKTQSKWFNCVHVTGNASDINALEALAFVDRVEFAAATQNRPALSNEKETTTGTNSINYGTSRGQIEMLGLDELHDGGFTGSSVKVAILDSGFPNIPTNPGFSRLINQNGILGGYDFVDRNDIYFDDNFHGARVLSVMAGSESGNFEGAAPDASYYLFRTEEDAQETPAELSYWVAAAERADSLGVQVINVSLGYLNFDNPSESLTYNDLNGSSSFITRGANVAFEKGMAVVVSAGNSGRSNTHPFISAPADALGAFAIGSVNSSEQRSPFSSIGPTADGRIVPDVMAQGTSTASIDEIGNVVGSSGTSFSAPLISAAIACLMQAFPDQTPAQIYDLVRQSSSNASSPDNFLGYGIPDFGQIYQLLSGRNESLESNDFYVDGKNVVFALSENEKQYKILAMNGQLVHHGTLNGSVLDLSQLRTGIYLIQLNNIGKYSKLILR
ncbi:MAG: S8 family serine peptidase [Nonlabens sp.]